MSKPMRKIDAMHERFGVIPGERCENCANLIKGLYNTQFLRKCTVYGATHSEASDWRKRYVACGMFNREYNGNPIIELVKREREKDEVPIEGQLTFYGGGNE